MLVSGLLSSRGAPAGVLNLVINSSVILVLDTRIFDEYADVLRRKKFAFPEDAVQEILMFIQREGIFVPPLPVACTVPDPGDLPFIEVSLHSQVPVVTGNTRHFQGSGAEVMTPAEFIERYREGMLLSG
ncbi:MAG: PIN domain-containing protein [Methanoregula sp.]|nr:PIN domain-containing protein [Methanoregula sp.]